MVKIIVGRLIIGYLVKHRINSLQLSGPTPLQTVFTKYNLTSYIYSLEFRYILNLH